MRSSTSEIFQNEERMKEYHRQQERLKALTVNSDSLKPVSADAMIESMLKESFAKPVGVENKGADVPLWLESESPILPVPYKHLWSLVKVDNNYADTQRVSQLLLTSGLPTEVLGFIWNIANKSVPGQLNKQEFYIVLALVALAQSGYTFNNLSILNMIPSAPYPVLQPKILGRYLIDSNFQGHNEMPSSSHFKPHNINPSLSTPNLSELPKESDTKPVKKTTAKEMQNNFPLIGSSPTAELEDDFSDFQSVSMTEEVPKEEVQGDDFTDFQCADLNDPFETVVISQKKEIPKIPLPRNLTGKLSNLRTNILKISPESEKKLKMLSTQSESLTTLPESKISTSNKVSTMPSISVLGGSRDIGMRLANHSLVTGPKTKRHHRHKSSSVVDDILSPSKFGTMEELFPKCFQKGPPKTFVLKETRIRSVESTESESSLKSENDETSQSGKNTRKIEIPMLGTFNETTLPTQTQPDTVELFTVEEDKYSALREVEMEMKQMQETPPVNPVDDFGEFLSADIPPASEEPDIWGEWTNSEKVPETKPEVSDLLSLDDPSPPDLGTVGHVMESKPDFGVFFPEENSLPSLDLKMSPSDQDQESAQKKCLSTCLNLLQQALDIFTEVSPKSVLEEVFATEEAADYLNHLNIIIQISRRISSNFGDPPTVQDEIEDMWRKLSKYCIEYDIQLKEDLEKKGKMGTQCSLCLGYVGEDGIDHGIASYHPSCANFWVNCIDSSLPCPVL